jgi:small subunit ribosomal protein S1
MAEMFAKLLEEQISNIKLYPGALVNATVVEIGNDYVIVDAGLKSEGLISTSEFIDEDNELEIAVGDVVEVAVETPEDGFGETILSRERAKRIEAWRNLEKAHGNSESVIGVITDRVKGGFTVSIGQIKAFLPGSLVDVRPVRDPSYLEGKKLEFKVIKMDQKRNNIVVSRRAVVEEESSAERQALLESLTEGQEVVGIVKNLTDYGAFIDLGGIDGLLHITDISWKRVKHPSEVLTVGDEVKVKILSYDKERKRVSLGMKQLNEDPWSDLIERYTEGTRLRGKVTNITDYGCFVEIEDGIEGLVHMSEMDWTNKNVHPSKIVQLGDEVDVMVLEIDQDRRRISLGMKQCVENPWLAFANTHAKGDKVTGNIRSITDFGIFIGLEGNIDGLIHLSDISWDEQGEEAVKSYRKGQEVTAVILGIDAERERISLGIKQLASDPFGEYIDQHGKGTIVEGTVTAVDAKGAQIELAPEVMGTLAASEMAQEAVSDASTVVTAGQTVEAKIIQVDRKNRQVTLSIKAKDIEEEAQAIREYTQDSEVKGSATLGDLLKEKMDKQKTTD